MNNLFPAVLHAARTLLWDLGAITVRNFRLAMNQDPAPEALRPPERVQGDREK